MENTTLPTLTGSEKQIEWAETIRAEKIQEIEKIEAQYGSDPRFSSTWLPLIEKLLKVTRSDVWITYRSDDVKTILNEVRNGNPYFTQA